MGLRPWLADPCSASLGKSILTLSEDLCPAGAPSPSVLAATGVSEWLVPWMRAARGSRGSWFPSSDWTRLQPSAVAKLVLLSLQVPEGDLLALRHA